MNKKQQRDFSKPLKRSRLSLLFASMALFVLPGKVSADADALRNKSLMTLKSAFEFFEEKTGCTIAYSTTKLDVNKTIEINTESENVTNELNSILNGLGFSSRKEGSYIIIMPKPDSSLKKGEQKSDQVKPLKKSDWNNIR